MKFVTIALATMAIPASILAAPLVDGGEARAAASELEKRQAPSLGAQEIYGTCYIAAVRPPLQVMTG